MNKRDELMRLLDPSYKASSVPAAFFLHFDPTCHRGQAAVDKHLEFFRFTGMDLVKIQFEHRMPVMEMQRPKDWSSVPLFGKDFWQESLAVVKGIVESARKEALVVPTLYSPFMLACHIAKSEIVVRHMREDPEAFRRGIEVITEGLLCFVKECIKLGVDGFYASTQGGESGRLADPKDFDECVRPYDLTILNEIDRSCPFNILHVCDYHLPYADLAPFTSYPGHVVNTSLKLVEREIEAKEAGKIFGRPFMGGLERTGVITNGTPEAIRQTVRKAIESAPERFILGADCTVPSDTPWENLREAIQAAHEYRR
jgi:uroporphyrinogen decarboxylase